MTNNASPQATSRDVLQDICNSIIDLVERKSKDYGQHDPERALYFPFGNASYAQMEYTKMQRIMSLVRQELEGGSPPNFESLDDSVRDLVAYGLFHLAFLRKQRASRHTGDQPLLGERP